MEYESRKARIRNSILKAYTNDKSIVNDDARLLAEVYRYLGWDNTKSLEYNFTHLPRPGSVTRRRRELYNEGLIKYSDEALKDRTEAFNNEKN